MAEPDQQNLLDSIETQTLCRSSENSPLKNSQVHVVTSEFNIVNETLGHQDFVSSGDFDSATIRSVYAVAGNTGDTVDLAEVECDTHTVVEVEANNSLNSADLISSNNTEADTRSSHSQKSEAHVDNTVSIINDNTCDIIGDNSTEEAMCVESNRTYSVTVDANSLQENQLISLPEGIDPNSVIITQSNDHLGLNQEQISANHDSSLIPNVELQQIDNQFSHASHHSNLIEEDLSTQIIGSDKIEHPQAISVTAPHGITMTPEVLQKVLQQVQAQQQLDQQNHEIQTNIEVTNQGSKESANDFTLLPNPQTAISSPPLGSSQNPIRIIQQGNRYTPVQQLTTDQLQQIMQVVQQQHVSKNAQDNGGTVIFNPQTNTRIMYRVIYPSELHKNQHSSDHHTYQVVRPNTSTQEQQTGIGLPIQKRPYRKRKDLQSASGINNIGDEDVEKGNFDNSELSKEQKEERKKHRPRTRSGRVSKPPKHMVQDYKRIHVLDWDEDYDDSDGGYSDFKHSDNEEGKVKQEGEDESNSLDIFSVLGAGKPKNHKCQTCDKSYIGQAGLARHYRLNRDHCITPLENGINGSLDGEDSKDASLQEGSISLMSDPGPQENPKPGGLENFSEDSNTQDSVHSVGTSSPNVNRGRGRGGFRGRGAHFRLNAHVRRKAKLKELMKKCSDEELMEVVLPRLVSGVSSWEFLLMKSEMGGTRPQVDVLYKEFDILKSRVKKVCSEYLKLLSTEELEDDNLQCKMIKVNDPSLAQCLGLSCSTYKVEEMAQEETNTFSSLHNKLSAAAINMAAQSTSKIVVKEEICDAQESESLGDSSSMTNSGLFKRALELPSPIKSFSESKRARLSSFLPLEPIGNATSTSTICETTPSFFTVSAQLPSNSTDKPPTDRSDSSLSSVSSLSVSSMPSPKSHVREHLPIISSSPSSIQAPIPKILSVVSGKSEPITTISTSNQTVSYIVKSPMERNVITTNPAPLSTHKSNNQTHTFPILISKGSSQTGSSAQVLPFLSTNTQQKVMITAPNQNNINTVSMPIVLAPSSNSLQGSTVLMSAGMPPQRVIVRQPHQQVPKNLPTQVIIAPQNSLASTVSQSKQSTSLLPPRLPFCNSKSPNTPPSSNSSPRSLLKKPAEVKVSRQLFHDTTSNNLSTSNGQELNDSIKTMPFLLNEVKPDGSSVLSKIDSESLTLIESTESTFISDASPTVKTEILETKPSVSDHDLEVLPSSVLNLSGDELVNLNTSTDSLNGVYSSVPNSVINSNIVIETGSVSEDLLGSQAVECNNDSVAVMCTQQITLNHSDNQSLYTTSSNNNEIDRLSNLINGSSTDFSSDLDQLKHDNSSELKSEHSLLKSPVIDNKQSTMLPFTIASSDFINIAKPSSPMTTSPSKESLCALTGTTINIGTNGAISSHILESEDMPGLQLNDPEELTMKNQNQSSELMPQNMASPVSHELALDTSGEVNMDEAQPVSEEGGEIQPLFTEGTNIYQTEDGTLIIQSSNGQTYQLQGAQGVPLETVQALLSGQIAVDNGGNT